MLRLAMFFIFARLHSVSLVYSVTLGRCDPGLPVLEPNLHRPLGHVDVRRNPLPHESCGGGILIELNFEGHQLILGGSLAFLVLLLLGQRRLPRRPSSICIVRTRRPCG